MYLSPSPCEAPRLPLIPYICLPLAEPKEEEARLDVSQMFLDPGMKARYAENMGQEGFSAYGYSFSRYGTMKHDI